MSQEPSPATYDESKEPKSFERCGPFIIDYKRCYSGFGTAVKHNGVEYILVCNDYGKLEDLVTETLSARIEQGFFRVIVAPESKASALSETPRSEPTAWAIFASDTHEMIDLSLIEPDEAPGQYVEPLFARSATREKLLAKACDAAFSFIDSHVADPDLTSEMCVKHADYREARRALEGTP